MEGEITEIFDENGDTIGTMPRDKAEAENHIIQNVLVFVFNSLGQVWIQKRPMFKSHYRGLWDVSACGAVQAGEDILVAAEREQSEEMGFVSKLHFVESFRNEFPDETGEVTRIRLSHLYFGMSDELPHDTDEVDEFVVVPINKLGMMVTENPDEYVPSFKLELDKAVEAYHRFLHE